MKLSEKGKAKIANLADRVYWDTRPSDATRTIEGLVESLKPNDFMTGDLAIPKKVWLTVEEAKSFIKQCDEDIDPADKPYSYSKVRLSILEQIEQAEGEK